MTTVWQRMAVMIKIFNIESVNANERRYSGCKQRGFGALLLSKGKPGNGKNKAAYREAFGIL